MRYWYILFAMCTVTVAQAILSPVMAQNGTPAMLLSSSLNLDQDFGGSLDLDGNVAVIGAVSDDDGLMIEQGGAYVFRYDGENWVEEAQLLSHAPSPFNWFGTDVAVSGNVIIVSELNGDELLGNAGNVNIFRHNAGSWELETILTPPGGIAGENFGSAVDVDGAIAAVGASTTLDAFADQGAVYVYRNTGTNWDLEATLKASDPGQADLFGASISIDGDRMLIGAFNAADSTSNQAGKVYVFEFDGEQWTETAILQSNESNNIANMGVSVSLDGDWAVSGAPLDNTVQAGAGAAIVHHFDGAQWQFHSKLVGSNGQGFYLFGQGVAVEDTILVVGAENWAPTGGNSTGKLYVFRYDDTQDEWLEVDGLVPENLTTGSKFGRAVAVDGGVILGGAPDFGGPGAAYAYGEPSTSTAAERELPVASFSVSEPFPNPFSRASSILVTSEPGRSVRVALYDLLGREISTLHENLVGNGTPSRVAIPGDELPAGVYLVRAESENHSVAKSIVLTR